jgi:hypothetical protein
MTKKTAAQYLTIAIVSVIAALALAEIYLGSRANARAVLPFFNRLYPYVMFRPHESTTYISPDNTAMSHGASKVFHYSNEDGLRVSAADYVLPKRKPEGQLRIAFLGGSAVQLGSTFETTLPGSLKTLLREKYPGRDIEVINAGIQSCVSRQSIAHLVFTVVDYQPDIVILYDGANDLGLPLTYESRPNFPYNFQAMEAAWETYRTEQQASLFRLLLDRSHLVAAFRSRFGSRGPSEAQAAFAQGLALGPSALPAQRIIDDGEYVKNHVTAYLSNWKKLIELSAAYGYKPVCILQPTAALDREFAVGITMKQYGLEKKTAEQWQGALSVLYAETSRQISELRQNDPETVFLDWKDDLGPADPYFWDLVHVYDEINAQLAVRMYEEARPLMEEGLARAQAKGNR